MRPCSGDKRIRCLLGILAATLEAQPRDHPGAADTMSAYVGICKFGSDSSSTQERRTIYWQQMHSVLAFAFAAEPTESNTRWVGL